MLFLVSACRCSQGPSQPNRTVVACKLLRLYNPGRGSSQLDQVAVLVLEPCTHPLIQLLFVIM